MKLGHGCRRRTPWWCWVVLFISAAVMLPGAARLAGEEGAHVTYFTSPEGRAGASLPPLPRTGAPKEPLVTRVYEVPVAAKTLYDTDGRPTLLVDLQVANQGTEPLSKLTVLVRVLDSTGAEKDRRRVTLDMTGVRPGIGARVSATLPGVELLEEDEVMVELETNLPQDDLHGLPEYAEVAGVS